MGRGLSDHHTEKPGERFGGFSSSWFTVQSDPVAMPSCDASCWTNPLAQSVAHGPLPPRSAGPVAGPSLSRGLTWFLSGNDPIARHGIAHEGGGRREIELAHDGSAARLDRFDADAEKAGDLDVGVACGFRPWPCHR